MSTSHSQPLGDRREELLLDRALFGLEPDENDELSSLTGVTDLQFDASELAAAATSVAMLGPELEAPPADVRTRMEAMALAFLATDHGLDCDSVARAVERPVASREQARPTLHVVNGDAPGQPSARRRRATQIVAVAATLLAAILLIDRLGSGSSRPDWQQLAQRASVTQLEWAKLSEEADQASGELVWDPETQQGFMRFRNLPPTANTDQQYQLWIFDRERPKKHPIDGGVFDVVTPGEVVVRIDAKLPVRDAFAFVVTREARGGVVVSKRDALITGAGELEKL